MNRKFTQSRTIALQKLFSLIAVLGLVISCDSPPKQEIAQQVEEVLIDEKFRALFAPDSGGVTGADGVFSVAQPNGESIFLMGDSFLGKVVDGKRSMEEKMMHNSFVVVNKAHDEARAIYRGTYDNPSSMIDPVHSDDTARWYWPGHGFTKDSILYIFALNMYNDPSLVVKSDKPESEMDEADRMTESMWAFQVNGVDMLSFSLPDFKQLSVEKVEYAYDLDIHFGNSVYTEGKYIYMLGTKTYEDRAKIHIGRTEFSQKPLHTNWQFFNGSEWVSDHKQSQPLDIDISVSEQFSLIKIDNKYVLLIQERSSGQIYTYTSLKPHTSFGNKQFIYQTPDTKDGVEGLFTYNAMAHPQYIEDGMLLVSYCVNGPVREIFSDVNNYRARFIRVPLTMIDSSFASY